MTLPIPNDASVINSTSSESAETEERTGNATETPSENKAAAGDRPAKRGVRGPRTLRRARNAPRSDSVASAEAPVDLPIAEAQNANAGDAVEPVAPENTRPRKERGSRPMDERPKGKKPSSNPRNQP